MTMHRMLAAAGVLLLVVVAGCGSSPAEEPAAAEPAALPDLPPLATEGADAAPRLVPIFKGEAELGYLNPVARTKGTTRVTTIKVKNLENAAIAGLTVDEFWYDAGGTQVAGSPTFRYPRLDPGEVIDVVLEVQMRPGMQTSSYRFEHANGTIKTTLQTSIEEEDTEP